MNIFGYLVLAFAGLLAVWQLSLYWRVRRRQGSAAPDLSDLLPHDGKRGLWLLYFHSEYCGPCRALTPTVDKLAERYPNVIKVDVREHTVLAQRFGVMGTPTFVLVIDGRIERMVMGSVLPGTLENWLMAP